MNEAIRDRRFETISVHVQFSISQGSISKLEEVLVRSVRRGMAEAAAAAPKPDRPMVAQPIIREIPAPREKPNDLDGMIDVKTVARLLSISTRSVYKFMARGQFPRPASVGRAKRWSIRKVRAWMDAGCPRVDNGRSLRGR